MHAEVVRYQAPLNDFRLVYSTGSSIGPLEGHFFYLSEESPMTTQINKSKTTNIRQLSNKAVYNDT